MSNKIRPWRKKDKKHFRRKLKFVKAKKPPPAKDLGEIQQFKADSYIYDYPTVVV